MIKLSDSELIKELFDFVNIVIASIFIGSLILVPCVLLFFKFYSSVSNKSLITSAVNCTLLLGSTIFILSIVANIAIGLSSGTEDVRYATLSQFFGPYWWAFWLVMAPGYFLPQLFWFKKLRNSIISSVVIVGIGAALSLFVKVAERRFYFKYTALEYLIQAVIFIIIFSGMYFLLSRKRSLEINNV
jgi:hypothetical protein